MRIETTILKSLISNESFGRKVLPYLQPTYFTGADSKLFSHINDFYLKYNEPPTVEALSVEVNEAKNYSEFEYKEAQESLQALAVVVDKPPAEQWLIDATEKFCQDQAINNALSKAIAIRNGEDKIHGRGAIPTILADALAVCFDPDIGHDFIDNAEERWAYYHAPKRKITCDLSMLNTITNGGISPKTLNIVMAGTGVGKSIFLCHMAAAYMAQGLNVLYVTLEMSEEELAKRIDANLLDLDIDDLLVLPKADYDRRIGKLKDRIKTGKLIIKEYPTAGASTLHIKQLLNELNLKKNFKPDVIMIDYLNIMLSSRIRSGTVGMYQYVKSITEEVRGLAVEFNVPVWSATQVNRTGFGDSDPEMDATSESFGLPMTADLLLCLIGSEALAALEQIMCKQLKNRYRDENRDKRFILGLNKNKMRFSDVKDKDDLKRGTQEIVRSESGGREEIPWEEMNKRLESKGMKTLTNRSAEFKY
jgi:archaellum biogenesis ATPase FlaH